YSFDSQERQNDKYHAANPPGILATPGGGPRVADSQWAKKDRSRGKKQQDGQQHERPAPQDFKQKNHRVAPDSTQTLRYGIGRLIHFYLANHHVYEFAQHDDYLYDLLSVNGGTDLFVGEHTLTHQIFPALSRQEHVTAQLPVDLDGICDL